MRHAYPHAIVQIPNNPGVTTSEVQLPGADSLLQQGRQPEQAQCGACWGREGDDAALLGSGGLRSRSS